MIRKDSQYEGEQQERIGDADFIQAFFQDSWIYRKLNLTIFLEVI